MLLLLPYIEDLILLPNQTIYAKSLLLSLQGVAMRAMNNILSKWIPVSERSRSLALVYSGMYLGSVTGLAFSPILIHNFGWPSVFSVFGSLGSMWFALWLRKVRRLPSIFLPYPTRTRTVIKEDLIKGKKKWNINFICWKWIEPSK